MTGEEIRKIRKKLRYSQRELAGVLGVRYETLCRWENGHRSPGKIYADKLRELGGVPRSEQRETNWIFCESNIRHIRNAVMNKHGLSFGLMYGLIDETKRFILARIRLRPETQSIEELSKNLTLYPPPSRDVGKMPLVGCFVASDREIRPTGMIAMFLTASETGAADLCMTYNRANDTMTLWRLNPSYRRQPHIVREVPYHVVGVD